MPWRPSWTGMARVRNTAARPSVTRVPQHLVSRADARPARGPGGGRRDPPPPAEQPRPAQAEDAVEDRPGETRGRDVRDRARHAQVAPRGEALHGEDEDVEAGHPDAERQRLGPALGPEVAVVPGEDGEGGERGRGGRRPRPALHGRARRAGPGRRAAPAARAGRSRLRGQADRGQAARDDRQPRQGAGRKRPGRSAERHEQRPAHEPGGGEPEALRPVVRERPRRRTAGPPRRLRRGPPSRRGRRPYAAPRRRGRERAPSATSGRSAPIDSWREAEDGQQEHPGMPRRPAPSVPTQRRRAR